MVTGIYGAVDQLRGQRESPQPPTPSPSRDEGETTVSRTQAAAVGSRLASEVPSDIENVPRGRSLALQFRFLTVLLWAAGLFARVLFWQVYVRKIAPRYVERTNPARWVRYARSFRDFAIARTGLFIKLGQFISTRIDALPESVVRELESLQDEVPVVPFKQVRSVIEREIGAITANFEWFDEIPVGAASLGQAHRAQLKSGERAVVKVQRPGIREVCYTDIVALKIVAWVADKFGFINRRADTPALVREFGSVVLEELSYLHEAANARKFAAMYERDNTVYIPAIYDAFSTDRILTMEDVTSIKISDFAALEAAGISRKAVAERLMDTYLKQVFEHFFFHADPHPGNLFIYPLPVDDVEKYIKAGGGRPFYLIFIDFGMTGRLTREIASGMVDTLNAVIMRDPVKLVRSYNELGFILPGADLDRIVEAAQAAFNEVWGMSLTEIRDMDFNRAANLAGEFSDLIKSMPFYLPQDFIYLGRTISILSGMATQLDSNFNPWTELEPYAQRLAAQGFGAPVSFSGGDLNGLELVRSLVTGDSNVINIASQAVLRQIKPVNSVVEAVNRINSGNLQVLSEPSSAHKAQLRKLEAAQRGTSRAVVFGAVLVASTLLYTSGMVAPALIGYAYCAFSALWGLTKG
jgi:predicted unusual protein kinase regulating ubiquinone biosynthesis (AarF/ABC1/UbiB family)